VHGQIAATALATTVDRIRILQSDTEHGGHDTGAYGSTGTMVAGRATELAAVALRHEMLSFAAEREGNNAALGLGAGAVRCGEQRIGLGELAQAAADAGRELTGRARTTGSPRSVAFNVHGFRVAVNAETGEIRILRSVHAADAGRVINPMQCRGQVEGA